MSLLRVPLMALALIGAVLVVGTASAAPQPAKSFSVAVTEDFSPSCPAGATCGTAFATPYGPATVVTEITALYWLPGFVCLHDEHTSTLTFPDGSTLVLAVVGELCPTFVHRNFVFSGTFAVVGASSTHRFSDATGSGTVRAFRDNGPIHSELAGTIVRVSTTLGK